MVEHVNTSAWQFKLGTNDAVQRFLVVSVIHHLLSPALRPVESVLLLALDINVHILHLVDWQDAGLVVHASKVPVQGGGSKQVLAVDPRRSSPQGYSPSG